MADEAVVGLDGCVDACDGVVSPRRVAASKAVMITLPEAEQLAQLFRLIGEPTRARILSALLEAGELCVCDIATTVEVPETSVSHALRRLRTAGVVHNRREGRNVFYRLDDAHVRMLLDVSREHLRHEPESDAEEVTR